MDRKCLSTKKIVAGTDSNNVPGDLQGFRKTVRKECTSHGDGIENSNGRRKDVFFSVKSMNISRTVLKF